MHSPHIEERTATSLTALTLDIAQRLDTKPGKAVVVCEHTSIVASLTKKQWAQLLRTAEREHASTLDTRKRQELSQKIAWMRSLVFSAAGKADQLETSKTDVLFCTAETLLRYAPVCQTMYITYPIDHKTLHLITAWMLPQDTIICYRIIPKQKPQMTRRSVDYRVLYETSQ